MATASVADEAAAATAASDASSCDQQQQQQQQQPDTYYCYYELDIPTWLLGLALAWLAIVLSLACHLHRQDAVHRADWLAAFGVAHPIDEHANPPMRSLVVTSADLIGRLGPDSAQLFAQLDRDGNGLVSLVEFEALAHHIKQEAGHPVTQQATQDSLYPRCQAVDGEPSQCVRLRYRLTPPDAVPYLRYDPLSNALATVVNASGSSHEEMAAALANFAATGGVDTVVEVDAVTIATALLPRVPARLDQLRVGEPFTLIGPAPERLQFFLAKPRRLRPGVYFEPAEVAMATLLRPLHPSLFLYPRHGAERDSAMGLLRAESPSHLDLAFRLHPELQLAPSDARHSVYLTPQGLEGRLLLRRDTGAVELLEVRAADGASSCQVELPRDIPETGLVAALPHLSVDAAPLPGQPPPPPPPANWTREVPMSAALRTLRSRMLPHLAARFHCNLSSALRRSVALGSGEAARPIHVILALGGPQLGCDANCRILRDFALTDRLVRLRMRHYYVNAWINWADAPAVAEFARLTGIDASGGGDASARPPLASHLLDPASLKSLASYGLGDLRKALQPPDGLPNPLPPTPEAAATGEDSPAERRRRHGNSNRLTGRQTEQQEGDDEPPPSEAEDPEMRHLMELRAMSAIRRQVAESYMQFLVRSKA